MYNQSVLLANCPNFRDMGGYKTAKGDVIKPGILYRSSHLAYLSDTEIQHFNKLGIATVFDLRSEFEQNHYPSRLPEQVICHEFKVDVGSGRQFFNQLLSGTASCQSAHALMVESYERYITQKHSQLSHLLKKMSETTGSVLIHCMVGKDRTGVVIALLLLALGVSRADIAENYLLSNEYYPAQDIMQILYKHLKEAGVESVSTASMNAMETYCSARREYLQAAFDAIDIQYGGTEYYLTKKLGLTKGHLQNLALQFLMN